ncbi:topoisomerase DNA-binding C4 zinc finger domain-containing protein [Candidatus Woesearchaeota archaeon]|nr:topoisomerase DNA-binding C4 zinc finger domain-containing protein [Candidatus Woesearchaeota archaeon]
MTKLCPKCSKELVLRRSMYGAFYGCSGYPACKTIVKIPKETILKDKKTS